LSAVFLCPGRFFGGARSPRINAGSAREQRARCAITRTRAIKKSARAYRRARTIFQFMPMSCLAIARALRTARDAHAYGMTRGGA
jgi:hypothetical protein